MIAAGPCGDRESGRGLQGLPYKREEKKRAGEGDSDTDRESERELTIECCCMLSRALVLPLARETRLPKLLSFVLLLSDNREKKRETETERVREKKIES